MSDATPTEQTVPETSVESTPEVAPAPAEEKMGADATTTTTASTTYTLTGPSALTVGVSGTFTVTPNNDGPSVDTTLTFADGNGGGTFSPTTVILKANVKTPVTVEYTPSKIEAGKTVSVSATNDKTLTDPAAVSVSVAAMIPDAPVLMATAGMESVTVSVQAPAFNGGAEITEYSILMGEVEGVANARVIDLLEEAGQYTEENLIPGKTYYFYAGATNSVGTTYSAGVTAVPVTGDSIVDGAASDLTAALATLKPLLTATTRTSAGDLQTAQAYWAAIEIAVENQTSETLSILWDFYKQNLATIKTNGTAGLDQIDAFYATIVSGVQYIFLYFLENSTDAFDQFVLMRHGVNVFQMIAFVRDQGQNA